MAGNGAWEMLDVFRLATRVSLASGGSKGGCWMTPRAGATGSRVRLLGLLLIGLLVAGPVGTHVYWLLGGTWGLHRSVDGRIEESTTTGIRVVAAVVLVLLVAAVLVVLARVGWWRQELVSDRVIRLLTWALAAFFLLEAVAAFTYSREYEWWLYGPVSLVIGLLAVIVAASGSAWPHFRRPRRTLPSH